MTKAQAQFASRKFAKDYVRGFFKREGIENFNFELHESKIIKRELHNSFKMYWASWDILTKSYVVMTLGNKIVSK